MLGEQLIKNERIALVELVKNSYDADATIVSVDFRGFSADWTSGPSASIVVTDNGNGMDESTIRTTWMNPATPSKSIQKRELPTTPLGRVLQGEKGIGRFATFKLGNQVDVVSRAKGGESETTLLVDIAVLDENEGSASDKLFLEDVQVLLESAPPAVFTGRDGSSSHGTRIEMRGLRAMWTLDAVESAFEDLDRLQPLMWSQDDSINARADFEIVFLRDGVDMLLGERRREDFQALLERAVLRVTSGRFSDIERSFTFKLNDRPVTLSIDDPEIRGLRVFRDRFALERGAAAPECGSFGFEFYIFDFSANAPAQYYLDRDAKAILKEHRVYLYRDGIRVYPYGDPLDDWLQVDTIRGTRSARSMFSNDQNVGYVAISQSENPGLKDKTNREGLLDAGRAPGDFVALIQTVLSYLRAKPYEQYSAANRRARERSLKHTNVDARIEALRKSVDIPSSGQKVLDDLQTAVHAERELTQLQLGRTLDLAGVGLSVETASHDLISAGNEALRLARQIVSELRVLDLVNHPVYLMAQVLVTRLEFVADRFQDVQGLFVSTRQKQTVIDVMQVTKTVKSMYSSLHDAKGIEFQIDDALKVEALTTRAAVLQCVINLVDNATYWVMTSPDEPRMIRAFAKDARTLVITDNGPGIKAQDAPYIFEEFYSGRGEEGKGLGLYIARQNGLRHGFRIDADSVGDSREMVGATFVVRFGESEGEE